MYATCITKTYRPSLRRRPRNTSFPTTARRPLRKQSTYIPRSYDTWVGQSCNQMWRRRRGNRRTKTKDRRLETGDGRWKTRNPDRQAGEDRRSADRPLSDAGSCGRWTVVGGLEKTEDRRPETEEDTRCGFLMPV